MGGLTEAHQGRKGDKHNRDPQSPAEQEEEHSLYLEKEIIPPEYSKEIRFTAEISIVFMPTHLKITKCAL